MKNLTSFQDGHVPWNKGVGKRSKYKLNNYIDSVNLGIFQLTKEINYEWFARTKSRKGGSFFIGTGNTPQQAIDDLLEQINHNQPL